MGLVFLICEVKTESPCAASVHGSYLSLLPLSHGMARNPSAVQSVSSWRAGETNALWPSQICFRLPAKLGTPSAPCHGLEPQQLSPDMKGSFQAAWCCWGPQSLPGCAVSVTLVPGFSECLVQGGERELCWRGDSHSLPR